jgi:phosphatidylserine/phosphatidylglycerophosphate/cardiolipin synthase-like enzyme
MTNLLFNLLTACAIVVLIAAHTLGTTVATFFSPRGGAQAAIISRLDQAQSEILVTAYALTSEPITNALLDASKRGVQVYVIVDRRQTSGNSSTAPELAKAGVPTKVDRKEPLMHQKTITIDRKVVLTGSFNFSATAENRNAETLLVIDDTTVANATAANFLHHWTHSQYVLPNSKPSPPDTTPGPTSPAVGPGTACPNGQCPTSYQPASRSRFPHFFQRRL